MSSPSISSPRKLTISDSPPSEDIKPDTLDTATETETETETATETDSLNRNTIKSDSHEDPQKEEEGEEADGSIDSYSSKQEVDGWIYIKVKGTAKQRGLALGYHSAEDFKKVHEMLEFDCMEEMGQEWLNYFVEKCSEHICPVIQDKFPEFYEEMSAMAEGVNKWHNDKGEGFQTSVEEIVAWNNIYTLIDSWYPTQNMESGSSGSREGGSSAFARAIGGNKDHCSAFIYTKDGEITMAHNSFTNFINGQYYNYIVDMTPVEVKAHRILMQSFPCGIWSGTDFFVTDAGIMGTETTIGGFNQFELDLPIACRIRKAMQYGDSLDDYERILLEGNSGDYANTWLFGDANTGEIMSLELGLKYHKTEKKKDGYFFGCNVAFDPKVRNFECSNSGYCDVRRHQGARQVRLPQIIDQMIEKGSGVIDVEDAKAIISDHHDVYLEQMKPDQDSYENPCSRTICAHYELDAREYMSDPSRPKPFQPRGAVDGSVMTSEHAKNMQFMMRWGNSCGRPFDPVVFCEKHAQWKHLLPYLHARPEQPWSLFPPEEGQTFHSMIDEEASEEEEEAIREAKESESEEEEAKEEDPNLVSDTITDLEEEIESNIESKMGSEIKSEIKSEIIDELSPIIRSEVAKVEEKQEEGQEKLEKQINKQAFGGKSSIIKRLTQSINKAVALNPSSRKRRK